MGDWPGPNSGGTYEAIGLASSTTPVDVAASATPNTEAASWTEIVSATVEYCDGFWLSAIGTSATSSISQIILDIGIGAASSEIVLVSHLLFDHQNNKPIQGFVYIPIPIPGGTRVAARIRCSVASHSIKVGIVLQRQGNTKPSNTCTKCVTYGDDTSDSGGTSIDPGVTANTEGAWTQMTSSTTDDTKMVIISLGNQANASRNNYYFRLDLGIGGSGSEVAAISNIPFNSGISTDMLTQIWFGPFPVDIPAGTRIALRLQCSGAASPARLVDAAIHCFG